MMDKKINIEDMWRVYDAVDNKTPLCYCISKSDASLVVERMTQIDTVIVAPGKEPDWEV